MNRYVAEGAGLEPANPVRETVFETVAIAAMRPFLIFVFNIDEKIDCAPRWNRTIIKSSASSYSNPLNYGRIQNCYFTTKPRSSRLGVEGA